MDFKPLSRRSATLPDYKRISIASAVYPTAIYCPGSKIQGQVYQITADDLEMLDIYEGVEWNLFAKTQAIAYVGEDCEPVSVFVYTKGSLLTDVLEE